MSQSMTTQFQPASAPQQPPEWPFVTEFFMVESPCYRGMAYRDQEGKWRNAFNHVELSGEIQILE